MSRFKIDFWISIEHCVASITDANSIKNPSPIVLTTVKSSLVGICLSTQPSTWRIPLPPPPATALLWLKALPVPVTVMLDPYSLRHPPPIDSLLKITLAAASLRTYYLMDAERVGGALKA